VVVTLEGLAAVFFFVLADLVLLLVARELFVWPWAIRPKVDVLKRIAKRGSMISFNVGSLK